VPRPRERARELPVDELVAEDPRRPDRHRQDGLEGGAAEHDGAELEPIATEQSATELRLVALDSEI
jgi:hypothetical protein